MQEGETGMKNKKAENAITAVLAAAVLVTGGMSLHSYLSEQRAKIYYEKQIMEIMGKLGEKMPNRLALEEQGQFDLGYYHQMQKKYEKREEK